MKKTNYDICEIKFSKIETLNVVPGSSRFVLYSNFERELERSWQKHYFSTV